MSRKFVQRDGLQWVDKGIITREQYGQILKLYEEKEHAVGMLPILGSVLVGLGILSYIAANWQGFPELVRLVLIVAVMVAFYLAGDRFLHRGQEKLGIALIGVGLYAFGGGIFLVGQMYHIMMYNAGFFIVWAIAGVVVTYLYRSCYLFVLSLIILNIAQIYSLSSIHGFSWTTLVLMIAGLGYYWWKNPYGFLGWLLSFSVILQAIMLISKENWAFTWFFIPLMLLYVLGDALKDRLNSCPLYRASLISAFIYGVFAVLFGHELTWWSRKEYWAEPLFFISISVVLFVLSVWLKSKKRDVISLIDWILFIPFFYILMEPDVLYLIALFLFSLYVLWQGYAEEWRLKINLGTVLFIFSTLLGYIKLTWGFMDKSIFFIIGGVILLGLSWFLNRRRNQFLKEAEVREDEQ